MRFGVGFTKRKIFALTFYCRISLQEQVTLISAANSDKETSASVGLFKQSEVRSHREGRASRHAPSPSLSQGIKFQSLKPEPAVMLGTQELPIEIYDGRLIFRAP